MITNQEILKNICEITPESYNLHKVKICVMETLSDYMQNFESIYNELLVWSINNGILDNPNFKAFNLTNIYDTALDILDDELEKQYIQYIKVKKPHITRKVLDDLELYALSINKQVLENYNCRIITNSIYGLHYKFN